MEYCGFLNFWFLDRPLVARVAPMAALGIRRMDIWGWRPEPVAELAAECRRLGVGFNAAFDDQMGSLADPGDNEPTLRSWAENLEMAELNSLAHLYLFSNQVDVAVGRGRGPSDVAGLVPAAHERDTGRPRSQRP